MQHAATATIVVEGIAFDLLAHKGKGLVLPAGSGSTPKSVTSRQFALDQEGLRLTRLIANCAPHQFRYEHLDVRYAFDGLLLIGCDRIADTRTRLLPMGAIGESSPLDYEHVEELCCEGGTLVARRDLSPTFEALRARGLALHEELKLASREWLALSREEQRTLIEREQALIVEAWADLDVRALRYVSSFYRPQPQKPTPMPSCSCGL